MGLLISSFRVTIMEPKREGEWERETDTDTETQAESGRQKTEIDEEVWKTIREWGTH